MKDRSVIQKGHSSPPQIPPLLPRRPDHSFSFLFGNSAAHRTTFQTKPTPSQEYFVPKIKKEKRKKKKIWEVKLRRNNNAGGIEIRHSWMIIMRSTKKKKRLTIRFYSCQLGSDASHWLSARSLVRKKKKKNYSYFSFQFLEFSGLPNTFYSYYFFLSLSFKIFKYVYVSMAFGILPRVFRLRPDWETSTPHVLEFGLWDSSTCPSTLDHLLTLYYYKINNHGKRKIVRVYEI